MSDEKYTDRGIRANDTPPADTTKRIAATIRSMELDRIAHLFDVAHFQDYQLVALREQWAAWCEAHPTAAGYTWPAAWKGFRESGQMGGSIVVQR